MELAVSLESSSRQSGFHDSHDAHCSSLETTCTQTPRDPRLSYLNAQLLPMV